MTYGSRYRVPLRRRREKKTDYQARKAFVVSGKPRLVSRSSLKNTVAQIVVAKPVGDEVLASAHSRELVNKYGWKAATGNVPAAYLTGLLCGLKAKKTGVEEAILDIGLVSPTKGAKVFATLSGVVDAGIEVPHNEDKIVKERTRGYHIQDYAESLGQPAEYAPMFSASVAKGVSPDKFSEQFFEVRNSILTAFGIPIPKPETRPPKPKPKPKSPPVAPSKPAAKSPEAKAEAKPQPTVEVKKSEVPAEAKPALKAVRAPEPETKPTPSKPKVEEVKLAEEVETKPKEKARKVPKTKVKKAAPAKAKAAKAERPVKAEEVEAEPEAKPKKTKKTAKAEEESAKKAKPAKKSGSKKA